MKAHKKIIEIGILLEVLSSDYKGICWGYTLKCMESFLLGNLSLFYGHVKTILSISDDERSIQKIKLLLSGARQKMRSGLTLTLTSEEIYVIHLVASYVEMDMYQIPVKYSNSTHAISQLDILSISKTASKNLVKEHDGLCFIYSEIGIYTKIEINEVLNQFVHVLHELDLPDKKKIGFLLTSHNHVLALTYQDNQFWQFIDINDDEAVLEEKILSTEEVVDAIFHGFKLYPGLVDVNYLV